MDFTNDTVILSLTADKSVIVGGQHVEVAEQSSDNTESSTAVANNSVPDSNTNQAGLFGGNSLLFWGVIIAVYFVALYFFGIRPNKKREQKMKELQESLKIGDNVITSAGFHGKIVDTTDTTFVIEFGTNKGVRIPVNKSDVMMATNQIKEEK